MYKCAGPRLFVADKRAALAAKLDDVRARLDAAAPDVRHPLEAKITALQAELSEYDGRADDEYLGRAGCGHDLTAQIDAVPDDGDEYEYKCPACGNVGSVRKVRPE